MLSTAQMSVLRFHFDAGDRIAYYTALADFGDDYGRLALEVVLNNTVSGASANSFFRDQAGGVSNDTLAAVSLALMQADFLRRSELNGDDLTVDDIQRYHREVFNHIAGVTADAWTPNMYLDTFETLAERQVAWDEMVSNGENFFGPGLTFVSISARRATVTVSYLDENPQISVQLSALWEMTRQEMLDYGLDAGFADWLVGYNHYLLDLQSAGTGSFFFVSPNGPYQIGIPEAGSMIGGSGGDNNLVGASGDDVMIGMGGDDTYIGGNGADRFYGGDGTDQVNYSFESSGISIQLGELQGDAAQYWASLREVSSIQQILDGQGHWDVAIDVEEIVGSHHDDILELHGDIAEIAGSEAVADGYISGGSNGALGDKIDLSGLESGGGIEAFFGESGYVGIVDRTNGSLPAIYVEGFENLIGSARNDRIDGNDQANGLNGHLGADTLFGGGGTISSSLTTWTARMSTVTTGGIPPGR